MDLTTTPVDRIQLTRDTDEANSLLRSGGTILNTCVERFVEDGVICETIWYSIGIVSQKKFKQVAEVYDADDANALIKDGWELLHVGQLTTSDIAGPYYALALIAHED